MKNRKFYVVPKAGLEPARVLARLILSQVRLPIPPQRHKNGSLKPTFIISYQRIKSKHFILGWKNRFPLVSE